MKTKKILALALTAIMLVGMLAACSGNEASKQSQTPAANSEAPSTEPTENNDTPDVQTKYAVPTKEASVWQSMSPEDMQDESIDGKTVAYQFIGFSSESRNVSVNMELYDDGYARVYQYTEGGEGNLSYIYYGYWTPVDDEYIYTAYTGYSYEGETNEEAGVANGDLATLDYSYELYDQDGQYSFGVNVCLGFSNGGQYVRSAEVSGDGTVQYSTIADWTAYVDSYWAQAQG